MFHRYLASALGLVCVALAALSWVNRRDPMQPRWLPLILLSLVIFQGVLGMWTVTMLLKPIIVLFHLLGGRLSLRSFFCSWFLFCCCCACDLLGLLHYFFCNSCLFGFFADDLLHCLFDSFFRFRRFGSFSALNCLFSFLQGFCFESCSSHNDKLQYFTNVAIN